MFVRSLYIFFIIISHDLDYYFINNWYQCKIFIIRGVDQILGSRRQKGGKN